MSDDQDDIYERTPSKFVNDFISSGENTEKRRSESNIKSSLSSSSSNQEKKNKKTKIFEESKKTENSIKNENNKRRIRKPPSRSEVIIPNHFSLNENHIAIKNMKQLNPLNSSNIIQFIKNIDISGVEMNKSPINKSNKVHLFSLIKNRVFVFKKNDKLLLNRQKNFTQILRQLDDADKLISVNNLKNEIKFSNMLGKPNISKILPKSDFEKIKDIIANTLNNDSIKENLIKNNILNKEPILLIEKTCFIKVIELINEILEEKIIINNFLEENKNLSLEKFNLKGMLNQIDLLKEKEIKSKVCIENEEFLKTQKLNEKNSNYISNELKKSKILDNCKECTTLEKNNLETYLDCLTTKLNISFLDLKPNYFMNRQNFSSVEKFVFQKLLNHMRITSPINLEIQSNQMNLLSRLESSNIYNCPCENNSFLKNDLQLTKNLIISIKEVDDELESKIKLNISNISGNKNSLDNIVSGFLNDNDINEEYKNNILYGCSQENIEKQLIMSVIDYEEQKSQFKDFQRPNILNDVNTQLNEFKKITKDEDMYITPQKKNQKKDNKSSYIVFSTDSKHHHYINSNLRKTLSEIHQIANEDILTSFIKSSAKRDKNHKLNLIKIANDNVEKKTETKIRKRKTITKSLNFENSNNYLHEKEDLINKSRSLDSKVKKNDFQEYGAVTPRFREAPDNITKNFNDDIENLNLNARYRVAIEKQTIKEISEINIKTDFDDLKNLTFNDSYQIPSEKQEINENRDINSKNEIDNIKLDNFKENALDKLEINEKSEINTKTEIEDFKLNDYNQNVMNNQDINMNPDNISKSEIDNENSEYPEKLGKIFKVKNNFVKFHFNKIKLETKNEYDILQSTISLTPIEINIKYYNDKFKPILTKINKFKFLFNFKCDNQKNKITILRNNSHHISIDMNNLLKKDEKNIDINYSLLDCPLKKMTLKINFSKNLIKPDFMFLSNKYFCNSLNLVCENKNNVISYQDIFKIIEHKTKNILNDNRFNSNTINSIKNDTSLKTGKFYYLSSQVTFPIVERSLNKIDQMVIGSNYYKEINKITSVSYLDIRKIENQKIFSHIDQANNSFSLLEISNFLNISNKHKNISEFLFKVTAEKIDLYKKIKNEKWRMRNFLQILNISFLEKLDILFVKNFDKGDNIKKRVDKLNDIINRINDINKSLKYNSNSFHLEEYDSSSEKPQKSVIVNPSAIKEFSNYGVIDNTVLTMKLNNYDKKNLKKKMIIDNLRLKHIEALHVQIVDERERYSKLLLEKDKLTREVDKKKYYYIEIFNRGMIILITILFILIIRNMIVGIKYLDNLPVESFTNE